MKLKDVATITKNKRTQQVSFCLKARQLKKKGITPEELMEAVFIKPKVKFGLKKTDSKKSQTFK